MERIRHSRKLQARADAERAAGHRIALVPTMGALHEGHLSLIAQARKHADRVWVSIFVNPAQFNEKSDFESYPADFEADWEACERAGADVVFTPSSADLYPAGAQTWVDVDRLSLPLCGATRPGHFRGVATVVTKLLVAARPHVLVLGEKDFQQLVVLRRLVIDLGFDVEVVGAPTVREPDGLALSSRNVRLGPVARSRATVVVRALDAAEAMLRAGERDRDRLLERVRETLAETPEAGIDYAELRDPMTLELASERLAGPVVLALAVRFPADPDGQGAPVRLIDNRVLNALPATASEAADRNESLILEECS